MADAAGRERRSSLRLLLTSRQGALGAIITTLFVVCAVLAPYISPRNPLAQNFSATLRAPGRDGFPLGSDELGRDTLSRLVYGSRVSLAVGACAVGFGLLLGVPVGVAAGYYRGAFDSVAMRLADLVLAFPGILLAITIVAMYGIGFWTLVIAVAFPDVPVFARLVRASTLRIAQLDFIAAARGLGSRNRQIMRRHILPNVVGPVIVQATFSMATAILAAGGLSFLGLGIRPPTAEWGAMLAQARTYMRLAPHLLIFPGAALALVVFGINFLGDALRLAYEPRLKGVMR